MKNKRGVTLVTLVITIIVLFILAGVAINLAINSDGIVNNAKRSGQAWNEAQKKEQNDIEYAFNILNTN